MKSRVKEHREQIGRSIIALRMLRNRIKFRFQELKDENQSLKRERARALSKSEDSLFTAEFVCLSLQQQSLVWSDKQRVPEEWHSESTLKSLFAFQYSSRRFFAP